MNLPAVDRKKLFSVPLAAFTSTRNALVKRLRKRGATAEAAKIAAYKRPTRTVWVLNQVARRHPDEVRALLDAITTARRAQSSRANERGAAGLREAGHSLNARVGAILSIARSVAREDGARLTATQERTISRALHALPFATRADVERFAHGTLVVDLEVASDAPWFGTIEKATRGRAPKSRKEGPSRSKAATDAVAKRAAARAERERLAREKVEAKLDEREARRIENLAAKAAREASSLEREAARLDERAGALRERAAEKRRESRAARRAPPMR